MSSKGLARVGDTVEGTCNGSGHTAGRHFIGTWSTGSPFVFCDGIAVVRVGDSGVTDCGHHFIASDGSTVGDVLGIKLHRVGDPVIVTEGGTGVTTTGSPTIDLG